MPNCKCHHCVTHKFEEQLSKELKEAGHGHMVAIKEDALKDLDRRADISLFLEELGHQGFRGLTYHTDGRWIAQSGKKKDGKRHLTSGRTPEEALKKMVNWYRNQ